jgi:hypothetical protein
MLLYPSTSIQEVPKKYRESIGNRENVEAPVMKKTAYGRQGKVEFIGVTLAWSKRAFF